jgi:hypothetical protein
MWVCTQMPTQPHWCGFAPKCLPNHTDVGMHTKAYPTPLMWVCTQMPTQPHWCGFAPKCLPNTTDVGLHPNAYPTPLMWVCTQMPTLPHWCGFAHKCLPNHTDVSLHPNAYPTPLMWVSSSNKSDLSLPNKSESHDLAEKNTESDTNNSKRSHDSWRSSVDHSCQVSAQFPQWFLMNSMKCHLLRDDGSLVTGKKKVIQPINRHIIYILF